MNDVFDGVNATYGFIDQYGISLPIALGAILVSLIILAYAAREIAVWLLKINEMRRDMRRLEKILLQLEARLDQQGVTSTPQVKNNPTEAAVAAPKPGPQFTLNH